MKRFFKNGLTIITFLACVFFTFICYISHWDLRQIQINLFGFWPESILQALYDNGVESIYPSLQSAQDSKGYPERIVFYTRMAEKGRYDAACQAGFYLGELKRFDEQKMIWEKYALKGDGCSAIERFYLGKDPVNNIVWLEQAIKNNPRECRHVRHQKYLDISIPENIEQLCHDLYQSAAIHP